MDRLIKRFSNCSGRLVTENGGEFEVDYEVSYSRKVIPSRVGSEEILGSWSIDGRITGVKTEASQMAVRFLALGYGTIIDDRRDVQYRKVVCKYPEFTVNEETPEVRNSLE